MHRLTIHQHAYAGDEQPTVHGVCECGRWRASTWMVDEQPQHFNTARTELIAMFNEHHISRLDNVRLKTAS